MRTGRFQCHVLKRCSDEHRCSGLQAGPNFCSHNVQLPPILAETRRRQAVNRGRLAGLDRANADYGLAICAVAPVSLMVSTLKLRVKDATPIRDDMALPPLEVNGKVNCTVSAAVNRRFNVP
jgi:hypothetical protein